METSVISGYFDFWGKSPKQKQDTRKFWKIILPKFKLIVSELTINELRAKTEWWPSYGKLIKNISSFKSSNKAKKNAQKYINLGIVPKSKFADALHFASACDKKVDYFVTWNAKHFTRPFKRHQITEINQKLKIHMPTLAEPIDFLNY